MAYLVTQGFHHLKANLFPGLANGLNGALEQSNLVRQGRNVVPPLQSRNTRVKTQQVAGVLDVGLGHYEVAGPIFHHYVQVFKVGKNRGGQLSVTAPNQVHKVVASQTDQGVKPSFSLMPFKMSRLALSGPPPSIPGTSKKKGTF